MEIKNGYKTTELGIIPEDWEVKTLQSMAFVTSGKRLPLGSSLTDRETPHPYIRVTDMRPGTVCLDDIKFVPEDVFPSIKRYRIFSDDIFISVAGTLGIVGKVPAELNGANLTENADRITNITCSQDYLLHILQSPLVQKTIESLQTIGAQPKLALTRIRNFSIPFPVELKEQHAIAEALSDMDALIESLEQLIAKKRLIKQGVMQELLIGKRRLSGNNNGWGTVELRSVVNQFIVPMRDKPKKFSGNIPWCRIEDFNGKYLVDSKTNQYVDEETINAMNLKIYPIGTLLVSCSANLGKCAIVGRPLVTNQTFIGLVFDVEKANNEFFFYYMTYVAEDLNNLSSGTTISYLSREEFENYKVTIPLDVNEQSEISKVLHDLDDDISAIGKKVEISKQIKQGMMQELLTGRIRLI